MIACLLLLAFFTSEFQGWLFVFLMVCSILFVVNAQMAADDIRLYNWIFTPRELFESPIAFIIFVVAKNGDIYWPVLILIAYLVVRYFSLSRKINVEGNN